MNKRSSNNLNNIITLSKKDYLGLLKIRKELEKILAAKRKELLLTGKSNNKKEDRSFKKAFGVLKNSFGKNNSLNYVVKLRKAWRR